MNEQIQIERTSTIRNRSSRTGSTIVGESTTTTTNVNVTNNSESVVNVGTGLQTQTSLRRTSATQKFMGEIEFTGLNQTAKVCKTAKFLHNKKNFFNF